MDHYSVLNLPRTATFDQVKKAYFQIARTHHPDKTNDIIKNEKFKMALNAYTVLIDVTKRTTYDASLGPENLLNKNSGNATGPTSKRKKTNPKTTRDSTQHPKTTSTFFNGYGSYGTASGFNAGFNFEWNNNQAKEKQQDQSSTNTSYEEIVKMLEKHKKKLDEYLRQESERKERQKRKEREKARELKQREVEERDRIRREREFLERQEIAKERLRQQQQQQEKKERKPEPEIIVISDDDDDEMVEEETETLNSNGKIPAADSSLDLESDTEEEESIIDNGTDRSSSSFPRTANSLLDRCIEGISSEVFNPGYITSNPLLKSPTSLSLQFNTISDLKLTLLNSLGRRTFKDLQHREELELDPLTVQKLYELDSIVLSHLQTLNGLGAETVL
ncbi:hypothetical protein WICPIJ_001965 [Wickerhamomyces pijperi]|uniref:J domain-containing protein n=1 Tax=Wickerhamomyces pijperi TaxID=599730 RepID=A0A9P8QAL8_WICPI|nr:hypothetical protein WICPIJ_001965 [Wickerhamomyces pijperi]